MTDSKTLTAAAAAPVTFAFNTEEEIRIAQQSFYWDNCCILPEHAKQAIEARAKSRSAMIQNGSLLYRIGGHYHPSLCCPHMPGNWVPETASMIPLDTFLRAYTRQGTYFNTCCWTSLCVRDTLSVVDIDTSAAVGIEASIYGLRSPSEFIKTVATMARDEKFKSRVYYQTLGVPVATAVAPPVAAAAAAVASPVDPAVKKNA
jgi:hypothetical protein